MFVCFVLAIICGVTLADLSKNGRIVGGELVTIETVPYQVSIQGDGVNFCGGAIIHPEYILTAGHCAFVIDYTITKEVVVGLNRTNTEKGQHHKIIEIIIHPNFKILPLTGVPVNDIALIRVSPKFDYSESVQPISLGTTEPETQELVTITGYGRLGEDGEHGDFLMGVTIPTVDRSFCKFMYGLININIIDKYVFCSGDLKDRKDSCKGDSGGPVTSNNKLVGIVSFGLGCGRKYIPGVNTNVAEYNEWILKSMKNDSTYLQ